MNLNCECSDNDAQDFLTLKQQQQQKRAKSPPKEQKNKKKSTKQNKKSPTYMPQQIDYAG